MPKSLKRKAVIAISSFNGAIYPNGHKTGLFFEKQTVKNLASVLAAAATKNFNYETIADHAKQFSVANFSQNIKDFIQDPR